MVSIQFFFVSSFLSSMIRRFHWYAITCVCGYILISECAIWYHHYCCCCCCFWPRSYHYKGDALMCVCSWALGPFVFIELHFRRNSVMNACHFYQSSFNLSNVRHITIFLILFFHFFPLYFCPFSQQHGHMHHTRTLIFLLQYLELFADTESLISILSSVAPERRLRFDVIFCANDGRRLLASLLHSFKIVLESWSTWLFRVSSSFSANGIRNEKEKQTNQNQRNNHDGDN